jgi:hypothetical protein
MAEVKARRPDDRVVARFRAQAEQPDARSRRSDASISPRARGSVAGITSADLDELHTKLLEKHRELPDSTPLIREKRDRHG